MKSALESFSLIQHPNKVAILGDMKELGKESESEHEQVINLCEDLRIEYFTIGEQFLTVTKNGFNTVEDFKSNLSNQHFSGKLILLKGSRSLKLEELIQHL